MKEKIMSAAAVIPVLGLILTVIPGAKAAEQVNILVNSGFEEAGMPVDQGGWGDPASAWHLFGGGYARGSSHAGQYGIDITNNDTVSLAGAYQRIDLGQTQIKPVFVGGFVKGNNIVNSAGGYFGASIYAEIHLDNGRIVYWNSLANYGTFDWHWIGFNTAALTIDGVNKLVNRPISHIYIVPLLAYASGTASFDDLAAYEFTPDHPALTIMFDDGASSVYTAAKPVMEEHGFKGTLAIVSDMPGSGDADFMSWEEIKDLTSSGWGVTSHSRTHSDLKTLSQADMLSEINNRDVFAGQGLAATSFVTPFGSYNSYIMDAAEKAGYVSVRNYEQGDNPLGSFPNEIKVRGILDTTTPAEVAGWINEAKANNSWVVLTFHDVVASGDDAYHTTPEMFADMMAEIAASGVSVITYDEGVAAYGAAK
ncbi:MAG: polysaccharide deacetylase family protein [Candidatus Falkowbacteria bacterium]